MRSDARFSPVAILAVAGLFAFSAATPDVRAREIAVGNGHTCTLTADGGVVCWGNNIVGQLGDGTGSIRNVPGKAVGLASGVRALAAGSGHTCALTTAGSVKCWGYNQYGQVGDGSRTNRHAPVDVVGLPPDIVAIAAGGEQSCALTSAGAVHCWGFVLSELRCTGGGFFSSDPIRCSTAEEFFTTPREVPGFTSVVAISVGAVETRNYTSPLHTVCGVTTAGGVVCAPRIGSAAADVAGLSSGVAAVATGGNHACVVMTSGGLKCWGDNLLGQIGDGTRSNRKTPVDVSGITGGAVAIEVGIANSCALTTAGGVKCWGRGDGGISGDATASVRFTPVDAAGLTSGIATIATGSGHTCAVSVAGSIWCWGLNGAGQLGDGTYTTRYSPTGVSGLSTGELARSPGPVSGLWWNPAESGWGIHITHRRNVVFAAWYTYDAIGNPKWYVAPSCVIPSDYNYEAINACSSSLFEVEGPTFFGANFNPSSVRTSAVGTLKLTLPTRHSGTMSYTVNGQSRTVAIERQVFQAGIAAPAVDYTDLWWNPAESGWGLGVTQQHSVMFLAWYVYDNSGRPIWYAAPDCRVIASGNSCSGPLYRTSGPVLGATFNPGQVQTSIAGAVSLDFSGPNNGVLSYTVGGVTASKSITRQLF